MKVKDLVTLRHLDVEDILEIFEWTDLLKKRVSLGIQDHALSGKVVGMIFEKSSMRTRLSFEVGVLQLGGHCIYLDRDSIGLGKRESIKDIGRVMSRYVDGIVIRTYQQKIVNDLAKYSSVPVINGLSDYTHPCQALADLYTVKGKFGRLDGLRIAFVGDGNNVARSLALGCAKLGVKFVLSTPKGFELDKPFVSRLRKMKARNGFSFRELRSPTAAVKNADVIYTDVWASMGQEDEEEQRKMAFAAYQVNEELLKHAPEHAVVMHCLPAHRGAEITDQVVDGPASIVYDQAENRLHVQRALLRLLMGPSVQG